MDFRTIGTFTVFPRSGVFVQQEDNSAQINVRTTNKCVFEHSDIVYKDASILQTIRPTDNMQFVKFKLPPGTRFDPLSPYGVASHFGNTSNQSRSEKLSGEIVQYMSVHPKYIAMQNGQSLFEMLELDR